MKPRNGLTVVEGTPLQKGDIERAFSTTATPPDVTVVALNATRVSDSPFAKPLAPPMFIRDCVRNTTAVMAEYRVKRIVIMSAWGVGSSWNPSPWMLKLLFSHTNMSYQTEDHNATDADVRANDTLSWTLVRPVILKEGAAAPVRDLGETGKAAGLFSGITRASVAEFLVKAAETEEWSKKAVVISN